MEINERLATIQEMFVQEKHVNLSKNYNVSNILTCLSPQSVVPLKYHQPCNHSTCEKQQPLKEVNRFKAPQILTP